MQAGFTPADASFSKQAMYFKTEFEKLLCQVVQLSRDVVSQPVVCSGEIVTEFTSLAEQQTERYTGIPINRKITDQELRLCGNCSHSNTAHLDEQVCKINKSAIRLLNGLIRFKETILRKVLHCEMFTMNYPLLIEHIIREAKLYRQFVEALERDGDLCERSMRETECFWNQIMMEHALFIRGLLDPAETELFKTADTFASDYAALLESCRCAHNQTLTADTLEKTIQFRDFKAAGAQGIEQCKIRSVILPLLADHVLREANHYIRLLRC